MGLHAAVPAVGDFGYWLGDGAWSDRTVGGVGSWAGGPLG